MEKKPVLKGKLMNKRWIARQGDVLFTKISKVPNGVANKRLNGIVAYGEVTGHSHALAVADQDAAEVLEIGNGLYVRVGLNGLAIRSATFVHEEHGQITLPQGTYSITIQREYQPEGIRNVAD